jgi:hypothetical protein
MQPRQIVLSMLLVAVGCLPAVSPVHAESQVVLARDHPNAAVFMQMARRGILDYTARNGSFPAGLQALQDAGYTAYLFPINWRPGYEIAGNEARVNLHGHPVYIAGQSVKTSNIAVVRPRPGLYHDQTQDFPDTSTGAVVNRPGVTRVWHFPGANWLAEGKPWPEVDRALQFERIAIHLNWMTYEYNQAHNAMPTTVHDLEAYQGTERNSLGWRGVTEVSTLATVAWEPGNLYAGWDRNAWVVSMNLGWGRIDTQRWVPGDRGYYTSHSLLVY